MMILSAKKTSLISRLVYTLLFGFVFVSCVDLSEQRNDEGAASTSTEQQGQGGNPAAQDDESTTDVSVNPSEFEGTYEATIPCEDCEGIETVIVLNNNQTFRISSNYMGKNKKTEDNGGFKLIENGTVIHLKGKDTDLKLKIEEDKLFQLDTDDQVIEGENAERYVYNKK